MDYTLFTLLYLILTRNYDYRYHPHFTDKRAKAQRQEITLINGKAKIETRMVSLQNPYCYSFYLYIVIYKPFGEFEIVSKKVKTSSSTCKEVGSCHSILTINKKLNRLKMNNSSWIYKKVEDTWQTAAPRQERQAGKYGQSQPPEQTLMSGDYCGNQCQGRKT